MYPDQRMNLAQLACAIVLQSYLRSKLSIAGEAQLSAHSVALCKNYRNAVVINGYLISLPADQMPRRVDRSDQGLLRHGLVLLKSITTPKTHVETFGNGNISSLYISLYPP